MSLALTIIFQAVFGGFMWWMGFSTARDVYGRSRRSSNRRAKS